MAHWSRRRRAGVATAPPNLSIWWKSGQDLWKFGQSVCIFSRACCNLVPFGQVRRNCGHVWVKLWQKWCLKCLDLKKCAQWNAVVLFFFLEVIFFGLFSGKFTEIWARILRTPKNLLAPTPMWWQIILPLNLHKTCALLK